MLLTVLTVVNAYNCIVLLRHSATNGNATQHTAQIELGHIAPVYVRRRSVCERCCRNQRARLQRRRTSTHGDVRCRTQCDCTRLFAVVVLICVTCTSSSRCFQVILTISFHNIRLVMQTLTVFEISEKEKNICKMPWLPECTTIQYKLTTNYNLSSFCKLLNRLSTQKQQTHKTNRYQLL